MRAAQAHRYMLYGGARGGGKSKLLRWGLVQRLLDFAMRGHCRVRAGLFSEDYPTLRDRQITKIRTEFPDWLGTIKSTQDEGLGFYLRDEFGGGALLLRNLDDPSKYQSAEFAAIGVEELTKDPIETFDVLRGSLRWPGIADVSFWGATNPGGIGHLWVRGLWIDRDYTGDLARFAASADQFGFVQALPKDNPHLDASYWQELESLPPQLYRAWVEGDWDVFEGQAFLEWDRRVHVTSYRPKGDDGRWRWWACGDWGYEAQGVVYLCGTGPERTVVAHEWLFRRKDPYDAGFAYGQVLKKKPLPEWVTLDEPPVADGGPSITERFQAGLNAALGKRAGDAGRKAIPVVQPPRGSGSRHARKQMMHEHLRWDRDAVLPFLERGEPVPSWLLPRLIVHESCTYLVRTLPALPLDETDSEDVDTDADDHGYDALSGGLMARLPQVKRAEKPKHPDDHPGWAKQRKELAALEDEPRWTRVPEGW
jgi:hypothetical protein